MPLITGTDQNDSLIGTEDPDLIRGLLGNDLIYGLGGDDQLEGGEGNDLMNGGLGNDLLLGGLGNDTLGEDQGASDQLFGEDGNDFLYYYGGTSAVAVNALLDGGIGDDVIFHAQFAADSADLATLVGGAGHDRIESYGGGHITIDAGADSDLVEITDYRTDYDIALGSGSDLLLINSNQFHFPEGTSIVVSDFAAGDNGDALSLISYLVRQTDLWNFADNPFAAGYMQVIQSGADAVIQVDRDGASTLYGFEDFVVLQNVSAAALTARNLGGYAANGSATAGATIDGTAAADFINGTSGGDVIRGLAGNDGLFGSAGADRLEGGDGNDTLDGELGDDLVYGGDGDDALNDMIAGSDQLYGEGGNDILFVDRQFFPAPTATLLLDGGDGNDQLYFLSGVQKHDATLIGGAGNDHINAYLGRNVTIDAGEGNDFVDIDIGIGNALITLGAGADVLALSTNTAPVVGFTVTDFQAGDGGDSFYLFPLLQRLLTGWDTATNPFAEDYLRLSRSGADTLLLYDASGQGTYFNVLGRLTGVDAAQLTAFNFGYELAAPIAILGTDGADSLVGTAGVDELIGQGGNDLLDGGAGADRLKGGLGNDTYIIDNPGDAVIEGVGDGGFDIAYTSVSYTLGAGSQVEMLSTISHGATAAINLAGNEFANTLIGNAGANILNGGGGADQLLGLAGNDVYFVDNGGDITHENVGNGNDIVYTTVSYGLAAEVEIEVLSTLSNFATDAIALYGNDLNQTLVGNAGANILDGRGGADQLIGLGGNDVYYVDNVGDVTHENAGNGYDTLYANVNYTLAQDVEIEALSTIANYATTAIDLTGNHLNNYIVGNAGTNTLNGSFGVDTLITLGGTDTIAFTTDLQGGINHDFIMDFDAASDTIALDDAVFAGLGLGALGAGAFVNGTAAGDADDRIVYNSATGELFFDADGAGGAAQVLFAVVANHATLTFGDFTVI